MMREAEGAALLQAAEDLGIVRRRLRELEAIEEHHRQENGALRTRIAFLEAEFVTLREIAKRAASIAERHAGVHDESCPRFQAQDLANMAAAAARRITQGERTA